MGDLENNSAHSNKLISYIELLRPGWWPACFFIGLTPGMLAILWTTGSLNDFFQCLLRPESFLRLLKLLRLISREDQKLFQLELLLML